MQNVLADLLSLFCGIDLGAEIEKLIDEIVKMITDWLNSLLGWMVD